MSVTVDKSELKSIAVMSNTLILTCDSRDSRVVCISGTSSVAAEYDVKSTTNSISRTRAAAGSGTESKASTLDTVSASGIDDGASWVVVFGLLPNFAFVVDIDDVVDSKLVVMLVVPWAVLNSTTSKIPPSRMLYEIMSVRDEKRAE